MNLLFGLIIGTAIVVMVVALYCALIIAGRSDEGADNQRKNDLFWNKQICPKCRTGKESYELDPKSDACPNISCWKNGKCPFYIPLEKPPKSSIFKRYKKTISEKGLNIE